MKHKVQGLMQKINYIEQDMELQKQILVTIPSKNEDDIKEVITNIASLKEKLNDVKLQIKEIDPEEYKRMIDMENATEKFREIAKGKDFEYVKTFGKDGDLSVVLKDEKELIVLVAAKEKTGKLIALTMEGDIIELMEEEIKEVRS